MPEQSTFYFDEIIQWASEGLDAEGMPEAAKAYFRSIIRVAATGVSSEESLKSADVERKLAIVPTLYPLPQPVNTSSLPEVKSYNLFPPQSQSQGDE